MAAPGVPAQGRFNRLTGISSGASFAYDAVGRRQSRTIGGATKSYLYDGIDVVQELAGGTPSASLLTGLGVDQRFTRSSGGATSTYLTDRLGSTVALADGGGTIQTSYGYDPYGTTGATGSASDSAFQFTGRENDGTGLYYFRARYYNPAWGRFIAEDPLGLGGGVNPYAYADGDPLNRLDPLGLRTCGVKGDGSLGWAALMTLQAAIELAGLALAPETGGASVIIAGEGMALIAEGEAVAADAEEIAAIARQAAAVSEEAGALAEEGGAIAEGGIQANRAAGLAAEAQAAQDLAAEGNTILGSQVAARTSQGLRVIDHLVQTPSGQIVAVEVKSGSAVRNAAQIAKDNLMGTEGAVITGKNAPPALRGQRIIMQVIERRY